MVTFVPVGFFSLPFGLWSVTFPASVGGHLRPVLHDDNEAAVLEEPGGIVLAQPDHVRHVANRCRWRP